MLRGGLARSRAAAGSLPVKGGAVGVSFAAWYARIAESHRKYLNPAGAAVLSEARTKREAAEAFKRSMRTWAANLRRATT